MLLCYLVYLTFIIIIIMSSSHYLLLLLLVEMLVLVNLMNMLYFCNSVLMMILFISASVCISAYGLSFVSSQYRMNGFSYLLSF